MSKRVSLAVLCCIPLVLSGCSVFDDQAAPTAGSGGSIVKNGPLKVVAASYPLAFAAQRVGGNHVQVDNLVKSGASGHDLELTPQDMARLTEAHSVLFSRGYQSAVDNALVKGGKLAGNAFDSTRWSVPKGGDPGHGEEGHDHKDGDEHGSEPGHGEEGHDHKDGDEHSKDKALPAPGGASDTIELTSLQVAPKPLKTTTPADDHDHDHDKPTKKPSSSKSKKSSSPSASSSESESSAPVPSADDHGDEGHEGHAHNHGGVDPHFWLDPDRYAMVATAMGQHFSQLDPDNGDAYAANTKAFVEELRALRKQFLAGTKSCVSRDFVTAHTAFAYLADAFNLEQTGISGLDPENEPSGDVLSKITDHVKKSKIKAVYAEQLVNKALADTVARATGATVLTLDPIEGISDKSAGKDYFEIMRSNLASLRKGQSCR